MTAPQKPLDWKVIAFALVACYVVPGIVLGGVMAVIEDRLSHDAWKLTTGVISMVGFLVPPVSGGYLAARFAKALAWRHVIVVGVLGALLSLLAFRATPRAMLLYALASVALAAFGGFIRLQGRPRK
jgi:MFS family permease